MKETAEISGPVLPVERRLLRAQDKQKSQR